MGERLELRAFRALGVPAFRRLLLCWERLRHRRGGGKNQNYHMRAPSPGGAAAFEGYLLYHDLLHGVSLALLAAVLLGKALFRRSWDGLDLLAAGMCVVNLWCLMLQRYNRLRLRQVRVRARQARQRRLSRRTEKLLSALDGSAVSQAGEDLALVRSLLARLSAGEVACLNAGDAPALRRMAALLDAAGSERRTPVPAQKPPESRTLDRLAEDLAVRAQPYSRVERRADRLQRRLQPGKAPLISLCAVVTGDETAEAAFCALCRQSSPEKIWETLNVLAAVLERVPAQEA